MLSLSDCGRSYITQSLLDDRQLSTTFLPCIRIRKIICDLFWRRATSGIFILLSIGKEPYFALVVTLDCPSEMTHSSDCWRVHLQLTCPVCCPFTAPWSRMYNNARYITECRKYRHSKETSALTTDSKHNLLLCMYRINIGFIALTHYMYIFLILHHHVADFINPTTLNLHTFYLSSCSLSFVSQDFPMLPFYTFIQWVY